MSSEIAKFLFLQSLGAILDVTLVEKKKEKKAQVEIGNCGVGE